MRALFLAGWFGCSALLNLGCSLVSFDDLQDGAGASSAGGAPNGGSGGNGGSSAGGAPTGGSEGGTIASVGGSGGSGATSASGGSGGTGGGVAGPPFDWTPSLTATWRFESTATPGTDSGPNQIDLQVSAGAPLSSSSPIEGAHALSLTGGARMASLDDRFGTAGSMTFGGWFKSSSVDAEGLMGRKGASHGYLMEHLGPSQSGKCWWEADGVITLAQADANVWLPDTWVHFACRYNANTTALSAMLDGVPLVSVAAPLTIAPVPFSLGYADLPFEGLMDEAFFVDRALTDADLRRVVACGIDGKQCTCIEADPESYASCGRAAPGCAGLPPCNAAAPEG